MRIYWLSDFPAEIGPDADAAQQLPLLKASAVALAEHDIDVVWIASAQTVAALLSSATDLSDGSPDDIPSTCRYVVPCQPYRLQGIRLFGVAQNLWQQPDYQTRLYTFLGLLLRELPGALLHAWGALSAAYVGVYAACVRGLPGVATYHPIWLGDEPQKRFRRRWVTRHARLTLVTRLADRDALLAVDDGSAERIQRVAPESSRMVTTLTALYRRLTMV